MYLSRLEIENFRIFGSRDEDRHLELTLHPGLSLLVGENDSGKTSVVDALRLLLGTLPEEYYPITTDDFHCRDGNRRTSLAISAEFAGLSETEAAAFLEYLEVAEDEKESPYRLRVTLSATIEEANATSSRRNPVKWDRRAGPGDDPPRFDGPSRNLLRATYLKPLRDAVSELTAKKGSRLSQILQSYPQLRGQEVSDWDPDKPESSPTTLIGILRKAEHEIRSSAAIVTAESSLNSDYLERFSIGPSPLKGRIGMPSQELRQLLERMELTLADHDPGASRGLGHHNVLFMAAELLALERDDEPCLPLILIEEPEAHLHPQLQVRLLEFFRSETGADTNGGLQILLTSHSPNIACKVPLPDITLMHAGRAFSLAPIHTKLDPSDYEFLERFLDVTRSELLFARGLLVVEGDAEAIAIPIISDLIGCSLSERGVSIINVGSVGLFRYSRILQRTDGPDIPVRVACIADRDVPPDEAKEHLTPERLTAGDLSDEQVQARVTALTSDDGGPIQTFVSDAWTFEYDLALHGLSREMHAAVMLAVKSKSRRRALTPPEYRQILRAAFREHAAWVAAGDTGEVIAVRVYAPLLNSRASKAEAAQQLARLLRRLARRRLLDLEPRLPPYLVAAIRYASRNDEVANTAPG
ncbi:MAG: AAA family ATPase [Phycisphaera sp.]|nr:MAG: AAA family ATPase [Phycisphaera sp.]